MTPTPPGPPAGQPGGVLPANCEPAGCVHCGGRDPLIAAGTDVCICDRYAYRIEPPRRLGDPTLGEQWRYIGHLLACRAGQRCERCGGHPKAGTREMSIHHRQPRAAGGTTRADAHNLANLLLLCAGHSRRLAGVLGCHGQVETGRAEARRRGLLVPHGIDPTVVPVTLWSGRRVLLDPVAPGYLPAADGLPYDLATDLAPAATA